MNGSSSLSETYVDYSLTPTDDWLGFRGQQSKSQPYGGGVA